MHVISSPMEEKRRNDLAASRAEEYAPRPTGGLFMAGVAGAGLLLAADAVISGFYGWRLRDNLESLAALMAAGFAGGLAVFLRLEKKNQRARRNERAQINRDEDAKSQQYR